MSRSSKQAIVGLGLMAAFLVGVVVLATRGNEERGLRAQVLSTRRAEPGDTVPITITAVDTFGGVKRVEVDFGDGKDPEVIERDPSADCRSDFARTERFDFERTYNGEGVVNVVATVTTGGCGAEDETVEAIRTITIKPLRSS
ncbi:MAG TPA: hypothetical protein VM345_01755 [Acidimicrobiales bacterium]|nr:hypothetical protein [Acidimicrobiales bacterium]